MNAPFDRTHPYHTHILHRALITKQGSSKDVFHLVINLEGSNITYRAGDSLGIYPVNDLGLVTRILNALPFDPLTPVIHPRSQKQMTLQEFFLEHANLSRVTTSLLKQFEAHPDIEKILQDKEKTTSYLSKIDVIDLIAQYGSCVQELTPLLGAISPLLPRLYSISSSPSISPHRIHLLVALTSFYHQEELRYGVASHFLSERALIQSTPIRCFIQPTPHFLLPADLNTPIIMIGPGTGIAPFLAFMQERVFHRAPGKNWIFFGERNQKTDFIYEEFLSSLAVQNKLLIDLAFSRDQEEKIYVQHRLLEKGEEVWQWLQEGAYLYICGSANPMAKDVEQAMLTIFTVYGKLSLDSARAYLKELRHQKRYLLDVY
ncbi:sulfite reductase [Rhabdochlamydiaceae symbiont of Dictyostelium giganteum]|uniref:sulfite reductase n=1 Tax=Rhabdochlamydiaceae symbiont of Dictyostelium giganteum TaxID=3342349 RepID=UPI00384B0887